MSANENECWDGWLVTIKDEWLNPEKVNSQWLF